MTDAQVRALLACATARAHPAQREALDEALRQIGDFSTFAEHAEREGIAPLVALHAGSHVRVPPDQRTQLAALAARHKIATQRRTTALSDALVALEASGIRTLFLKGAALAWHAYPTPELRAMRDVDLLVDEAHLEDAARVLRTVGFDHRHDAPQGCHEVYTMDRVAGGFSVRIDMHRRVGLFDLPSYRPAPNQTFATLAARAETFHIGKTQALAPSKEDLLRIVHRHGFALGLYERFRYTTLADLATAAEAWRDTIDWARLARTDVQTHSAICTLAAVVPLSDELLSKLHSKTRRRTLASTPYEGFFSAGEPGNTGVIEQFKVARSQPKGERAQSFWGYAPGLFSTRIWNTLAPPQFWLRMRHGRSLALGWLLHLCDLTMVAWRRWTGGGNVRR